jgi:dUTP pyrophosphatase
MSKIVKCKLEENGQLPVKAHKSDAGFDLFAIQDFSVAPGQIVKQPINVCLELPESTYAEITSKSGNGSKGLLVYAGIIDQGYRGIVHVVMTNVNHLPMKTWVNGFETNILIPGETLTFRKGQKIAQMILHPFSSDYELQQVDQLDNNTSRSSGGFGSTGGSLV